MNEKISNTLSFFAAVRRSNKIWCSNLNFNGLFTIDITTGKINYIGRFIGHNDNSVGLHSAAELYEDKLIFFPHYSSCIDSYDFAGNFYCCKINSWEKAKKPNTFTCSSGAYLWENMYYIFPRFQGMNLIKFSPKNNKICGEIELNLSNKMAKEDETNLTFRTLRVENYVYLPIFGSNIVIKYDLKNSYEEKITLHEINKIIGGIGFDGASFWLNSDEGISRYDSSFKERIYFYPCVSKSENLITEFVFKDNTVFALPAWFGSIKVIDSVSNYVREFYIDAAKIKLLKGPVSKWRHTGSSICFDDFFLINPIGINSALIMDYHTFEVTEEMLEVPFESIPFRTFSGKIYYEYRKEDLEDFIQFILRS